MQNDRKKEAEKRRKCQEGYSTNEMYNALSTPPVKIVILGAGCSTVSEATGKVSHFWNITQISYASVSPALSDKETYPRFFRTAVPDVQGNVAKIEMFKEFGWTRIAAVTQPLNIFSEVIDDLTPLMSEQGISLITQEIFVGNPAAQIKNLLKHDARIIMAGAYHAEAYVLFCEIFKQNMYGPTYVWITVGWYFDNWYRSPRGAAAYTDCSAENITAAVEGSIIVGVFYFNPDEDQAAISGINPAEFNRLYDIETNNKTIVLEEMSADGYDAVWAIALALNATAQRLKDEGSALGLEDFAYDSYIGDMIRDEMYNVSFMGIGGQTSFNENGDSIGLIKISRIENGTPVAIGIYDPYSTEQNKLVWTREGGPRWKGGHPPRDAVLVLYTKIQISRNLYIAICSIAALGIILAIGFLFFNIVMRKERVIKMSSPNINNVILLGCMVTYCTVFCEDLTGDNIIIAYQARTFVLLAGFSLAYGGLFSKTWRVYLIFTNEKMKRRVIKDWHLMMCIAMLLFINLIVVIIRESIDPAFVDTVDLNEIDNPVGDEVTIPQLDLVTSHYQIYFIGVLYAIQGILLLVGSFLAWETKKVKIEALNDSQFIGMSIYNVLILSILAVIISFALSDAVDLEYGIISMFLILGTTLTQCVLFVPKIYQAKAGNVMPTVSDTVNPLNSTMGTSTGETDEVKDLKKKLKQKEDECRQKDLNLEEIQIKLRTLQDKDAV